MWAGWSSIAWSKFDFHRCNDWWGREKIKSKLTFLNPAAYESSTHCFASERYECVSETSGRRHEMIECPCWSGWCRRNGNDLSFCLSTVPGFVSSVISAFAWTGKRDASRFRIFSISDGWRRDGVPPPKKIVSIVSWKRGSSARMRISVSSALRNPSICEVCVSPDPVGAME